MFALYDEQHVITTPGLTSHSAEGRKRSRLEHSIYNNQSVTTFSGRVDYREDFLPAGRDLTFQ